VNRFDRALGILLHLRGGERCSSAALAARFEVSTRTIYRDLDLLSALGVPVYAERGRGGGVRLMPGYFLPPISFSREEAVSLVLAVTLLRGLRARPFARELETATRKVLAAVPNDLRTIMSEADRLVAFEQPPEHAFYHEPTDRATADPALLERQVGETVTCFLQALLDRRAVHLRYRSPYRSAESETRIRPLGLLWDRDLWYLVGIKAGGTTSPRQWRADRVLRIAPGVSLPTETAPFDVRSLLGRAWLDEAMADWAADSPVRIRLTAAQVGRLKRDWYYGRARFDPEPGGTLLMTYGEDNPAATLSLVRWLGPGAELVEPVAWRELLQRELVAMLDAYCQ
jgi:predicted DNA-binding transcriptional regulator YafY